MSKGNQVYQKNVGTKVVGKNHYIHVIITLVLMFGFGYLPTFSSITELGMRILGIFIGCIYAWTVGMLDWPSILAMVAVSLTGFASLPEVVASTFGNQVLWLVMFSMVLCYAIENTGLLPVIAKGMLNVKFARRGPWSLAFVFMIAGAVAGFLTTNALTVIVILWKIFEEMVDELEIERDNPYVSSVLIMIVISATAGSIIAPFTGFVLISFGFYDSMVGGPPINALAHAGTIALINLAFYIAFILVFKFILRINVSFKNLRTYDKDELKLSSRQKIMFGFIILLAVSMMFPHILPAGNLVRIFFLERLGGLGIMICIVLLLAIVTKGNETFLDIAEGFKHGIPWGLFLMVGTSLMIATALSHESTGVTDAIIQLLDPLLEGRSLYALLGILTIASFILTNLINNNAGLVIFVPISIVLVQNAGGNPQVIVVLLALSNMLGYLLPASSAMGALIHGHRWLTSKQIYKYGGITMIIMMLVFVIIGVPLASFVFG